jgi:hypothetical protein
VNVKSRLAGVVASAVVATLLAAGVGYVIVTHDEQPGPGNPAAVPRPSAPTTTPGPTLSPPGVTLTAKPSPSHKPAPKPPPTPEPPPSLDFVISSLNVLGNSHTAAHGTHARFASGRDRARGVARLLAIHHVDVVGLQELQTPQLRALMRDTGGAYDVYPGLALGSRGTENSIAWRTSTWELVKPGAVSIPYFNGHSRPMPYVLLRNKATGLEAYFANFHNPADTRQFHKQQRFRNAATNVQIALVNHLIDQTHKPVFVTGDMNERAEYFCRLTGATAMNAARGGSNKGTCRPDNPRAIDWIFGSPDATFSDYGEDRSRLVRRTTDHPMVYSRARIQAESPAIAEATRAMAKARRHKH